MRLAPKLPLFALLLNASCLVELDVEVPEVCIDQKDVVIPARADITGPMMLDLGGEQLDGIPSELSIDEAKVTLVRVEFSSDEDLSFMRGVSASIDDLDVLSCDAESCTPGQELDLAPYLQAENLQLGLNVDGELPDHEWRADITVCFHAKTSVTVN